MSSLFLISPTTSWIKEDKKLFRQPDLPLSPQPVREDTVHFSRTTIFAKKDQAVPHNR
jgi:hypothetical protein